MVKLFGNNRKFKFFHFFRNFSEYFLILRLFCLLCPDFAGVFISRSFLSVQNKSGSYSKFYCRIFHNHGHHFHPVLNHCGVLPIIIAMRKLSLPYFLYNINGVYCLSPNDLDIFFFHRLCVPSHENKHFWYVVDQILRHKVSSGYPKKDKVMSVSSTVVGMVSFQVLCFVRASECEKVQSRRKTKCLVCLHLE